MAAKFKVGDHVTWNSEAGHVSGRIIRIFRTRNIRYKGYTHHASRTNRSMKSRATEQPLYCDA